MSSLSVLRGFLLLKSSIIICVHIHKAAESKTFKEDNNSSLINNSGLFLETLGDASRTLFFSGCVGDMVAVFARVCHNSDFKLLVMLQTQALSSQTGASFSHKIFSFQGLLGVSLQHVWSSSGIQLISREQHQN